ncbi:MAG: DUF3307 domain-containing protein [Bdellovibrionales bacterium]|nr:DUF3307 domain-containing protein [Bdellovibrionales bacterium]
MDFSPEHQLDFIFMLLLIYQIKHYIADFPLQREYMLRKTVASWAFLLPLATHCSVHAVGTLVICLMFRPEMWWLAIADFIIHFFVDRLKSGPKYFGRYNDLSRPGFWNVLGFDQMVHHITHIWIIYMIVVN